jgi:uncharacterized protein (TIGR02147 family)
MSVYEFKDYKDFIRSKISERGKERGYKTQLATAAGCQRSFLSLALSSHVHLTPDHAAGLSLFWRLSEDERDYFLELVNFARAGSMNLRKILKQKLDSMKRSHEDLATRFKKEAPIVEQEQVLYYSSWHWSAIHILLSVPGFESVDKIARRLSLSSQVVELSLQALEKMNLVARAETHWRATKHDIHLPRNSPLTSSNHMNWRHRAVLSSQSHNEKSLHYTAVHSLSHADYQRVTELLFSLLDRSRSLIGPSKEETIACMNIDWFET